MVLERRERLYLEAVSRGQGFPPSQHSLHTIIKNWLSRLMLIAVTEGGLRLYLSSLARLLMFSAMDPMLSQRQVVTETAVVLAPKSAGTLEPTDSRCATFVRHRQPMQVC